MHTTDTKPRRANTMAALIQTGFGDPGRVLRVGGSFWLGFGRSTVQKLTYVENCAEAIVLAAERPEAIGTTLNIVDDDLPTQAEFEAAQRSAGIEGIGRTITVPLRLVRLAASAADTVNRKRYGGKAKLPAFAMPAKMESQYRPLQYSNERAKQVLGWTPRYSLAEALQRIRQTELERQSA